jgi:ribonuclease VapC
MIVVDTSALLSILWQEPEADEMAEAISEAAGVLIAAPTRLEGFVTCVRRKGPADGAAFESLIAGLQIVTVPFDELQFTHARDAFLSYRSGRYGLNFGDCFSYALAKSRDLPLLFKGHDFRATDVASAI